MQGKKANFLCKYPSAIVRSIQVQFMFYNSTISVTSGEGLAAYCHDIVLVIDRLPYCSPLCLTLQTDLFFPVLPCALCPSTMSVCVCVGGGHWGQSALRENVWGDTVP